MGQHSRNVIESNKEEATGDDNEEEEEQDELIGDEKSDGEVGDEQTVQLLRKRKVATTSQTGVKKKRKTGDMSAHQVEVTTFEVVKKNLEKGMKVTSAKTPCTTGKQLTTSNKKNIAAQLPPGTKSKETINTNDDSSTD